MSAKETGKPLNQDENISVIVANLRSDKKRQIIRVVNPTDDKIEYIFKSNSNLFDEKLQIEPSSGSILPRSFAHIAIENKYFEVRTAEIKRLHLIYRKFDSSRRRGYVKGLVPINMIGSYDNEPRLKGGKFTWIILRTIRSIFLAALIIYNIILIKLKLMD